MNKILDGLYLGNFDAANDSAALKRCGITHILTVASGLIPRDASVTISLCLLIDEIVICLEIDLDLRYA